ncbi:hypothetical protein KIN20_034630 [Parelaphostrongylus tenuis]|uniref:Uncharacterized protein n=1 Tax=Parelaphostrongylus tenuis TaxID=148309 RepID=A0AAD5R9Y1_PARTN|nr:hypothetical protein KIN20_034630 [Parelaphostrongylus tenuis]
MMLFCRRDKQTQKQQRSRPTSTPKIDGYEEDFRAGAYHLRVAVACLLLAFWFIWIVAVVELAFYYRLWPIETCWSSLECRSLATIVLLHGIALLAGSIGWIFDSPLLTTFLMVPPVTFAGAVSGVLITFSIFDIASQKYDFAAFSSLCLLCFWVIIVHIVMIIGKYCRYLRDLRDLKKRNSFNIDVFKESFFGTPPLVAFNGMEVARGSTLSDSIQDDIFGDDYELDVVLQ